MSEYRQLLAIHHLPDRDTGSERLLMLRADVQDARDLLQAKLEAVSHRYANAGWAPDPDGINYEVQGRTVVATLRITRESST